MTSPAFTMTARIDRDDRLGREEVAGIAAAGELRHLAVGRLDQQRRAQIGRAVRRPPVHDDALGDAGRLVRRLGDRDALDQVLIGDDAVELGDDRAGIGIPLRHALAALDLVAVVDLDARAIGHAADGALAAVMVEDDHGEIARHGDQLAVRVAHDGAVADLHRALERRLDMRLLVDLRRTADMEGAHGELGARLADRLRRDDADRLAHVDARAAGKIAPVAGGADAVLGLAGEHRADLHLLDAGAHDRVDIRPRRSSRRPRRSPLPDCGSVMSSAAVRPRMRTPSEATTWPASMIARTRMPLSVPQSSR